MESEFYRGVLKNPISKEKSSWRVNAHILRKDSGEAVFLLALSAKTEKALEKLLNDSVQEKIRLWGKPPDWPRSPVAPSLIADYLDFANKYTGDRLDWVALKSADRARWATRINALPSADRLALVRQTPEQRDGCGHFNLLTDESITKHCLYQYIQHATPDEKAAHEELKQSWFKFCGSDLTDVPYPGGK